MTNKELLSMWDTKMNKVCFGVTKKNLYDFIHEEAYVIKDERYDVEIEMAHEHFFWKYIYTGPLAKSPKTFVWKARIDEVIEKGCPYIDRDIKVGSKLVVGFNDLKTYCLKTNKYYLLNEWDISNDERTNEVVYNTSQKYKWVCPNCGKRYEASPYSRIFSNTMCSCYEGSKYEQVILNYLETNGIDYKKEYTFSDLKFKRKLRVDFAIFKNKKLVGCIEFNGAQHYKTIPYFGGAETYNEVKNRDNIKRKYLLSHSIPCLYIPFWDANKIEKHLDGFINQYYLAS